MSDSSAAPLAIDRPPSSYVVRYEVTDWAGGERVDTVDTISVRRPYQGRVEVRRRGASADSDPTSRTVTDFGRVSIGGANSDPLTLESPPALAASDLRLDVVIADAQAAELVSRREQRRVDGERCQVFRSREPLAAGSLPERPASAHEYTDTCVGPSGLVLEEVWVTAGRVLRRRLAVDVQLQAELDDGSFAAFGNRLDPRQGGGSIRAVDPASRPAGARFWEGLAVPSGFEARGRFAVVPPQRSEAEGEEQLTNPAAPSERKRIGAVVDVWERGIDLLVLEQGGTVDNSAVFQLDTTAPILEVPGLATGQLVLDGRLNEIRFPLPSGRYVRVLGTLPMAELRKTVASLQDVGEGTGLVYLEPAEPPTS